MTREEANLTIVYLKEMQEEYIEGEGYERYPLPEWYALDKAIETIEQTRWIPVSERLPEEDGQYLITVKYKHVNDSYEDVYAEHGEWYGGRWDTFCFGHCGEVEGIIAWMPLPTPYHPDTNVVNMSEIPTGSESEE